MKKTILVVDNVPEDYPKEIFENYRFYMVDNMMETIKVTLLHNPILIIANIDIHENDVSILTHILKVKTTTPILAITEQHVENEDLPPQAYKVLKRPFSTLALVNAINSAPSKIEPQNIKKDNKGKRIGKYIVTKSLGSGASGTVYKATYGEKEFAIKILKAQFNNDMKRFNRETKYLMAIDHPNVIKAIEACQLDDEFYYIVMEIFEANHISRYLKQRGSFPLNEAIFIVTEIAKGMVAAHKINLIHRDLKPSNILYDRKQKKIKIIDFGIAKKPEDYSLTTEGIALGTPAFMSPEQIATPEIDHRADIYSLGMIFYALIVGYPPFESDDDHEVMRAQLYEPVPWPEEHIPTCVKKVIAKMLEKDRASRYQTMEEVELALNDIAQQDEVMDLF